MIEKDWFYPMIFGLAIGSVLIPANALSQDNDASPSSSLESRYQEAKERFRVTSDDFRDLTDKYGEAHRSCVSHAMSGIEMSGHSPETDGGFLTTMQYCTCMLTLTDEMIGDHQDVDKGKAYKEVISLMKSFPPDDKEMSISAKEEGISSSESKITYRWLKITLVMASEICTPRCSFNDDMEYKCRVSRPAAQ